jgi:hypothetical protein
MPRTPDDPSLVPDDSSTETGSRVGVEAREGAATAVEQTMQSPTMMEFKKRVANLRAMGREQFLQRSHEVASRIVALIRIAGTGPLPESVRPMNASDTQAKNGYLDSVAQLSDAEIADVAPKGAIVPDLSFDPACPLSLVIKRGSRSAVVGVHWALWNAVKESLAPEDAAFVRMVELKTDLEQRIDDYQRDRTRLQDADIDLDDPRFFEEDYQHAGGG